METIRIFVENIYFLFLMENLGLFEDFAIEVISACSNLKSATELIGINWDTLNCIMNRAVERGLLRRTLSNIEHIGIDEKQFSSGHDYISILNDLDDGRVLDVVHGRDGDSAKDLLMKIPCELRENVTAVAADLWKAYTKACKEVLPNADIVHDKFHISKYLNEAVDKVRKQENKTLYKKGEMTLVGSKYLWLKNPKNMDEETWATFSELKDSSLKTARAWAIKENFKCIWVNFYKECAESFFDDWYNWAIRSKLAPIVNVAMMLNRHKANIMNYFKHRITNAVSEGLNSRIQTIKAAARGFHSFENFRIRILFFCGKLELHPNVSH